MTDGPPPDPTPDPHLHWRRNLAAITAAVFIGFTGFTLVMPFLPIYIAQMGVRDLGAVATWTGVTLGVTPAMTALFAPLWGRLADRFGHKFMVGRSLVSFVVIMTAMAFATEPWHLLVLRIVQGFFAGYGALCLAMAAESAPPGRVTQSIGIVQTAQRLGPALGPVLGGVVAGLVGIRQTFFVTAVFYLAALVLLVVLYVEPRGEPASGASPAPARGRVAFRDVMAFRHFLLLMAVIFGFQFVDRSLGPVLPLLVSAWGVADERAALIAGVAFSSLACAAAVGHHVCARLLARASVGRVISRAALVAAAAAAVMPFVPGAWWLAPVAAIFGVGVGVATTAAYTTAAGVMPANARGAGFGFLTSASLVGMAISPMVAGLLARIDIAVAFAVDAAALVILALAVHRVMDAPAPDATGPPAEDA